MSLIYEGQGLCQLYGGEPVLKIDYFSLEKGECLALMGSNGSGKSTFLRLLAFLEKPSQGTLKYLGGAAPLQECTLLLQEPWLMHESVFRNVTLGLQLRGMRLNLPEIYDKAMRAAGFEKPEIFEKRRPHALSGGEKQRVALASRLALNPVVLLLDEPTAYVDKASAACIAAALRAEHEKGVTIICATHNPDLAKVLGANIMLMKRP